MIIGSETQNAERLMPGKAKSMMMRQSRGGWAVALIREQACDWQRGVKSVRRVCGRGLAASALAGSPRTKSRGNGEQKTNSAGFSREN